MHDSLVAFHAASQRVEITDVAGRVRGAFYRGRAVEADHAHRVALLPMEQTAAAGVKEQVSRLVEGIRSVSRYDLAGIGVEPGWDRWAYAELCRLAGLA